MAAAILEKEITLYAYFFAPRSAVNNMDDLFLRSPSHLKKMFTYMCQQCTALEDPISNVACQFLHGRLYISFGVSGVAFFEDGIIFPYFYLTRPQRQFLYQIASAIACDMPSPQRYRFVNGCVVLTDYSGRTFDQRLVWRMVLECVSESKKHRDCLRLLANVVIQRVMCRVPHSKDVVAFVGTLANEIFDGEGRQPVEESVAGPSTNDDDAVEWEDVPIISSEAQMPAS